MSNGASPEKCARGELEVHVPVASGGVRKNPSRTWCLDSLVNSVIYSQNTILASPQRHVALGPKTAASTARLPHFATCSSLILFLTEYVSRVSWVCECSCEGCSREIPHHSQPGVTYAHAAPLPAPPMAQLRSVVMSGSVTSTALPSQPPSPPGSRWFPAATRCLASSVSLRPSTYICWVTSQRPPESLTTAPSSPSSTGHCVNSPQQPSAATMKLLSLIHI